MGTWSRDGRWIFFRSDQSGADQIWKIPAEGGEAIHVTTGGGDYALESWDGRDVYYTKRGSPISIWRVPASGGEETEVLPVPGRPVAAWPSPEAGFTTREWRRGSTTGKTRSERRST